MKRPGLRELALLVISLSIALVAAELAFRAFLPLASRRSRYARLRHVIQYNPRFVREDPELGWVMHPGLDLRFENPEEGGFSTRIRTNTAGFRDDEPSLRAPRLLVLGDSFAFGWGVEESEALPARLEAALGIPTLNLGVSGYGTVQELLLFRRMAARFPLAGATVLLVTFFNDLEDNLRTGFEVTPWIESPGPPLALGLPGVGRLSPWMEAMTETALPWPIARRGHLPYLLARLVEKASRRGRPPLRTTVPAPREPEESRRAIFAAALRALRDDVVRAGARLVALHVPSPALYDGNGTSGFERVGGAFADLAVPAHDAAGWLTARDYWPLDGHWNAQGHAAVAERLAPLLSPGRPGP